MAQSATSSQVTYVAPILTSGTGTTVFTGSRRVDGIYMSISETHGAQSTTLTFYDIDGNVLFVHKSTKFGATITGSWLATNGLKVKSNRTISEITVTHSAEGV